MRSFYKFLLTTIAVIFIVISSYAQLSVFVTGEGNTTPNLDASYTSLADALTALNGVSAMTGPVTLTLAAGSETAPIKGFVLGSATLNPVLSATNTITIVSSGTVTINADVGTSNGPSATPDGMFVINGADYVTIDGITFTDGNSTNATVAMEFGIALFKRTAGDGCNFVTIQNCTFNMQRINNASGSGPMVEGSVGIGVYNSTYTTATTALTPTNGGTLATNGTNSNNKFYSNTFNGGNYGIALSGFGATVGVGPSPNSATFLGDLNNDIGGSSVSTGNTVLNYGGGGSNASAGIRANNQWSVNISYNTLNNNNGSGVNHTNTLRGIYAQAGISANATINNNNITIKGGGTTTQVTAIENGIGSTSLSNTISINNNIITGEYLTATSGAFYGIYNLSTATTVTANNNTINGWNYSSGSLAGTGSVYPIWLAGAGTDREASNNTVSNVNIVRNGTFGTTIGIYISAGTNHTTNGNIVTGLSITGSNTGGIIYGIQTSGTTVVMNNNQVNNLSNNKTTATAVLYGIYNASSPTNENYNYNTIHTLTNNGTGTLYGMFFNTTTGVRFAIGNTIYNLSATGTTIAGIASALSSPTYNNNKIYNITSTSSGAPTVSGILFTSLSASGIANVYNNLIGDLKAPNASGDNLVRGINITSTTTNATFNIFYNSIYLDASSGGTNFGTSGIFHTSSTTGTTSNLDLRNNIIINKSTANGTGYTVAFRRSLATLNNYNELSGNNLFYSGAPSASNLIYFVDASNFDQTLADFKTRVGPREQASVTENVQFQSLVSSSADYLKVNLTTPTQVESGAQAIATILDDYFGNKRQNDPSYAGAGSAPDIGAFEGDMTPEDLTPPSIVYTPLGNTALAGDKELFVTITDASGVPESGSGLPVLYWQINDDGPWEEAIGDYQGANIYKFTFGDGASLGDSVQYYIVAQDASPNVNVGAFPNQGIGTLNPDPPSADSPPTNPSKYYFLPSFSGIKTVGTAGDYLTLTGAGGLFEAINNNVVVGDITANIISDITEPSTIALNQWVEDGLGGYTLTIQPADATMKTLSGAPAATNGLIRLNGADRVTIDGSFGGSGRYLTFANDASTTANVAVIQLISLGVNAGATNNTIKNSIIIGNSSSTTSTFGIYLGSASISTSGTGAHNNNNTIENNIIERAYNGIYARGVATTGLLTSLNIKNNIIGSNDVNNYVLFRGVDIQNATAPLVEGNEIFNLKLATSVNNAGIDLGANVNDAIINKNKIYGIHSTSTSGYGAYGINISATTTSNITISNNVIYDIITDGDGLSTTAFNPFGIRITGGTNHKVYYNSINLFGSFTNITTSDLSAAIVVTSNSATGLDVRNNVFSNSMTGGAGAKCYAIYVVTGTTFGTINNNNYFTSGLNGIFGFYGADRADIAAWRTASTQDLLSHNVDPLFTSNTDLTINSGTIASVLESSAAVIAAVTTDFNGINRPAPSPVNGGGTAPDIGAYEFDGVPAVALYYVSSTTTQALTDLVTANSVNNQVIGVEIVVDGQIGTLTADQFNFSTNGTTSLADLTNAKLWFTGTNPTFGTTAQVGTTVTDFTGGLFSVTANTNLQAGTNYFWLTYDLPSTAVLDNFIDAECLSIVLSSGTVTPTITAPSGNRKILGTFSGVKTVGVSGDFPTLYDAFTAINNVGLNGNVTLNIISDITETQIPVLNQWTEVPASSNYTVLIQPQGGAWTVSGDLTSIVRLNGADRVTIDGLNTGGNALTIQNNSTATNTAAIWISSLGENLGSENVSIKNTRIVGGSSTVTTAFGIHVGGTSISTTGTGSHNNNLLIEGNTIERSHIGVYVRGVPTTGIIQGLNIINNTIGSNSSDFYVLSKGIDLQTVTGAYVGGNTIFNMKWNGHKYGIWLGINIDASRFTRNRIFGLSQDNTTTTYYVSGIYFSSSTGITNNQIDNNLIYDLFHQGSTSALYFSGIRITGGSDFKIYFNSINLSNAFGSTTASCFSAALNVYNSSTNMDIRNNIFSNSTTGNNPIAYAIYTVTGTTYANINFNNYYSTGTNLGFIGGTIRAVLDSIKVGTSQDVNSMSVDPIFGSPTDLTPLNSDLNMAGEEIIGLSIDFNSVTRTNPPDIGAIEFTPLTDDIQLLSVELIPSNCISTNNTINVSIKNSIGGLKDFSVNPLTVNWSVTGPVNSSGTYLLNTGQIGSNDTLVFAVTGINMSLVGDYVIENVNIVTNAINQFPGNDTILNGHTLTIFPYEFSAMPANTSITRSDETIDLVVLTNQFPKGQIFMTEVSQSRTAIGAPVSGWPAYLLADDYIEITGAPNADISGYVIETWSTSALTFSASLPSGTVLSPNGTCIIGNSGTDAASPSDFYYVSGKTANLTATAVQGYIIKDRNGNIVDAVGYGNYTFPVISGINTSHWSGTTLAGNSGIRLNGDYTRNSKNWINSSVSPQNPNEVNSSVTVPSTFGITDFNWSLNSVVTSVNKADTTVGPWIVNGTYNYIATYTNSCGVFVDTAVVEVNVPDFDLEMISIIDPETSSCYDGSQIVTIRIKNAGKATVNVPFNASYQVNNDSPVTEVVNLSIPSNSEVNYTFAAPIAMTLLDDTTFSLTSYVNIASDPVQTNDTLTKHVSFGFIAPSPLAVNDTVAWGNTATIQAQSTYNVKWYATASLSDQTVIHEGTSFTTPVLYSTTSYFASAAAGGVENTGKPIYTTTANTTGSNWGLVFNVVDKPAVIKTVDIYSVGTGGNITVVLHSNTGTLLQTVGTFAYPAGSTASPVKVTLDLDLTVPVGTGYRLIATSMGGNLIRETASGDNLYPYTSPSGNVVVTSGYISGTSNSYYWFYNWAVSSVSACESPRTEVIAVVNIPDCIPISTVTPSNITTSSAYSSWTAGSTETSWEIEFGTQGFTPTQTATHTVNSTPEITFTSLNASTTYEIYIRANCAATNSTWTGPFTFTTQTPTLVANPTSLNFGYVKSGNTAELSYQLSGTWLTAGDITIAAPASFEVSFTSGSGFASSLILSNPSVTLVDTTIYVRFAPTGTPANYSDSVTVVGGHASQIKVDVVGTSNLIYCNATATNLTDEYITNITFAGINNNSGSTGYSDFTSIEGTVVQGSSYSFSSTIFINGSYSEYVAVWIDWNQNGIFDSGERYEIGMCATNGCTVSNNISVPANAELGKTRMRVIMKFNSYSTNPCETLTYGEVEDYSIIVNSASKYLDVSVFLEGPFNGTDMNTDLRTANVIPLTQPYTALPWEYTGTETVASIPANVVDWVLVELRDAATPAAADETTVITGWPKAMFLKNDGSLVGLDGNAPNIGNPVVANNLYIVIRHRNHIDIMSAAAVSLVGDNYTYDFTDAVTKAYGGSNGYKQIATGVFGMVTGDADADGSVFMPDYNRWVSEFGNSNIYMSSDFDMDGSVFMPDYNKWVQSFGTSNSVKNISVQIPFKSQVPVSQ